MSFKMSVRFFLLIDLSLNSYQAAEQIIHSENEKNENISL